MRGHLRELNPRNLESVVSDRESQRVMEEGRGMGKESSGQGERKWEGRGWMLTALV